MLRFTDWHLKWYPLAVLLTLTVVFLLFVFTAQQGKAIWGKLGGDFDAFYGAGRIILEGDVDRLYDEERQARSQEAFLADAGTYKCFAYPPFVALPYALLAKLSYNVAYLVHTLAMVCILVVTLGLLFRRFAIEAKYFLLALTLSLLFYPLLRSTFGGQNTILTLLLVCLVWLCLDAGNNVGAGLCVGLMLFKPQFALPLAGLMILSRRWPAVISFAVTGVFLYIVCAVMIGAGWFDEWLRFALWFSAQDTQVNAALSVSWAGLLTGLFGPGADSYGLALSVVNSALLALLWFKKGQEGASVASLMPVTCVSLVLIPPRVIFYDAGLLLIACFYLVSLKNRLAVLALFAIWTGAFLQFFAKIAGFSPISLILVAMLIASFWWALADTRIGSSPGFTAGQ